MRLFIPGINLLLEIPAKDRTVEIDYDMMPFNVVAQARNLQVTHDAIRIYIPHAAQSESLIDPDGGTWVTVKNA